jgi:hypothetical protein
MSFPPLVPAKAGTQLKQAALDSRLRGNERSLLGQFSQEIALESYR